MSKNTYVFVGITEAEGVLVLAVMGTKDGSNNYDASGVWMGSSNLIALQRLKISRNIHMADFAGKTAAQGPMAARRPISSSGSLGNTAVGTRTVLTSSRYNFSKVIQFDPQGRAALQDGTGPHEAVKRLEVGLQLAHGDIAPAPVTDLAAGQIAAVQLEGITGVTHVFQP